MARLDLDIMSTIEFRDIEGLREFGLAHRFAHQQFADAIVSAFGVSISDYGVGDERARSAWELAMLDPEQMPTEAREALRSWLSLHANLHQAEYDAIGAGVAYDLSVVDFSDPKQFASWMFEHQQIHAFVADALGITQ